MIILGRIAFTLVSLLLVLKPQWVVAQEADALSNQHVLAAAMRQFQTTGLSLDGPVAIGAYVAVYDDSEWATKDLPLVVEKLRDDVVRDASDQFQPASTPDLGDEQLAYAGPIMAGDTPAQAAIVGWREGNRVYALVGIGLAGDMLTPLFDLGEAVSGRSLPSTDIKKATSPTQMSTGGVYELLLSLDDLPPGWVFSKEQNLLDVRAAASPAP